MCIICVTHSAAAPWTASSHIFYDVRDVARADLLLDLGAARLQDARGLLVEWALLRESAADVRSHQGSLVTTYSVSLRLLQE